VTPFFKLDTTKPPPPSAWRRRSPDYMGYNYLDYLERIVTYDRLYVTSLSTHVIYVFHPLTGEELSIFGSKTPSDQAGFFHHPRGLTVDETYLYICDSNNHRIQVLDKFTGQFIRQWGKKYDGGSSTTPNTIGEFNSPFCIYLDDESLYVSDNRCIQIFSKIGNFIRAIGPWDTFPEWNPRGMCVYEDQLYVVGKNRCVVFG